MVAATFALNRSRIDEQGFAKLVACKRLNAVETALARSKLGLSHDESLILSLDTRSRATQVMMVEIKLGINF